MQLAKFEGPGGSGPRVGLVEGDTLRPLAPGAGTLAGLLAGPDPRARAAAAVDPSAAPVPLATVRLLPPIDRQEVWGAGVTYLRSKVARQEESETGGSFYDLVYTADRPELFFKASPARVVGPGAPIRVRRDSAWSVPEPELALVLDPGLRLVGLTIGNDVSARDIEGRNPLYLPQAKVYDACCALGPVVVPVEGDLAGRTFAIRLTIDRDGATVFDGETSTARMARPFAELIDWLGREDTFPDGVILLTGTGIVPPDEFSLRAGDLVRIDVEGLGTLANPVVQGP